MSTMLEVALRECEALREQLTKAQADRAYFAERMELIDDSRAILMARVAELEAREELGKLTR